MSAPALVVLTPSSLPTARRLREALAGSRLHGPGSLEAPLDVSFDNFSDHLRELFAHGTPILALCAAGIVIRVLAPLLEDKTSEPPVLAIAEDGSVAVPLLGGHHGANRLAREVASILDGSAAITTAGELNLGFALDDPPPGWCVRNPEAAKTVMADLLAGRPVALEVQAGDAGWLTQGGAPFAPSGDRTVVLTERDDAGAEERLVLHPQVLALGVGCERGVEPEELVGLVETTLAAHGLARQALACVASIDLKAAEPAVQALAERLGRPARFFTARRLEAEHPRLLNPSEATFAATGCHGVAEGAALAAAGPAAGLVVAKTKSARATCAIARAAAPIDAARVGRPQGELALIGIGPGSADWRTPEAEALLRRAEHWVGYSGYLDLLGEPPSAGPARHGFALGEETERCRFALDLAAAGQRVALISSGDVGIYAMAALVLELLEEEGEDTTWQRVQVTVSPGISAMQAAAARVGAPLGHDFCAISLSDLLTPWGEIERRLHAAGKGDFVIALYNPASLRRRQGLAQAIAILAGHRAPETPVVVARNLGREGERVETTTIADFDPASADMLSIILVGSSRTRLLPRLHGTPLVYTARGYRQPTDGTA